MFWNSNSWSTCFDGLQEEIDILFNFLFYEIRSYIEPRLASNSLCSQWSPFCFYLPRARTNSMSHHPVHNALSILTVFVPCWDLEPQAKQALSELSHIPSPGNGHLKGVFSFPSQQRRISISSTSSNTLHTVEMPLCSLGGAWGTVVVLLVNTWCHPCFTCRRNSLRLWQHVCSSTFL